MATTRVCQVDFATNPVMQKSIWGWTVPPDLKIPWLISYTHDFHQINLSQWPPRWLSLMAIEKNQPLFSITHTTFLQTTPYFNSILITVNYDQPLLLANPSDPWLSTWIKQASKLTIITILLTILDKNIVWNFYDTVASILLHHCRMFATRMHRQTPAHHH